MRIRKNAKLSSILPAHASTSETLQTHVCQLNQSPWDVIPCPSLNYQQFEGEDSFTGNGSFGDSMGAVESVASMMDGEEKTVMLKVDDMIIDDNDLEKERIDNVFDNDYETHCCIKTDGKGWRCRNETRNGHTLCYHHLSLLKKSDKGTIAGSALPRRGGGRARAVAKANPYEFYYYSGFGPSWGKRRGDRGIEDAENNNSQNDKTPSSSSQIDFIDDEDDEDDENGDSIGRKRFRKPVKARSLKSLM